MQLPCRKRRKFREPNDDLAPTKVKEGTANPLRRLDDTL